MTTPLDQDEHETIVVFRCDPDGGVFALLPEDPADEYGRLCTSYEHIGQHGAANYRSCIERSRPATPVEYADLLEEMTRIGYRVTVRQREPAGARDRRRDEARNF